MLLVVAKGGPGFTPAPGFAANGYGELSPGGYSLVALIMAEILLTAFFLFVILGATDPGPRAGFAPMAIGMALVLIHLISIPVTNTSVNPARSTGPALFAGRDYIPQLWLFWLAPIVGGLIAGFTYAMLLGAGEEPPRSRSLPRADRLHPARAASRSHVERLGLENDRATASRDPINQADGACVLLGLVAFLRDYTNPARR